LEIKHLPQKKVAAVVEEEYIRVPVEMLVVVTLVEAAAVN
jgi:hypothetical protein